LQTHPLLTFYCIGAPLIAIVAILGLAVDLASPSSQKELEQCADASAVIQYITTKLDYLATSRPTAVNLFHAIQEVKDVLQKEQVDSSDNNNNATRLVQAVQQHAQFMLQRDLQDNRNIGKHGAKAILAHKPADAKVTVMTICNTGSLATSGYGTALGVVRALVEQGRLHQVVALETRPYNQGSRLTAFEMMHEDMPMATLISDSMVAAFVQAHTVDAIVVGADRVCANGDTANKIGTRQLSMLASLHQIPVYVAAPCTTLDASLKSVPPRNFWTPVKPLPICACGIQRLMSLQRSTLRGL
jgi:S-methyl-5-thioribose-1-phosphate isomerase